MYTEFNASECHKTVHNQTYSYPKCVLEICNAWAWEKFDRISAKSDARIAADARKLEAALVTAQPRSETVKWGCGHSVAAKLVMSASKGTCCPNCYDRMSD
jgi:hypothetical protein